ncbi:hypothetical protein ACF0H5_021531 [Mactra antiquata]
MKFVVFITTLLVFLTVKCNSSTTPAPITCDTLTTPCSDGTYCQDIPGGSALCRACDVACLRCYGSLPSRCLECQLGYRNVSGTCLKCPQNTFGVECEGTCHCLTDECDQKNGHCKQLQCDLGWKGVPECQTACTNNTFGSGCSLTCHCEPGIKCSPVNGLCENNKCAIGWSGAGCQNELPQLANAPLLENITCDNLTVIWSGWEKGNDRGDQNVPVARYELYSSYASSLGATPEWQLVEIFAHDENINVYSHFMDNLVPDAFYIFRVDVRQYDEDKLNEVIMAGKVSTEVYIPCTVTTTTTVKTTTTKKPGSLVDYFTTTIVQNFPIIIEVRWDVLEQVENSTIDMTLTYKLVKVAGVDCPLLSEQPESLSLNNSGELNVTNLLPWRQYEFNITATSLEFNLTEEFTRQVYTPEAVPNGSVTDLHVTSITKNSALITWKAPQCADRNGELLYYALLVFQLPEDYLPFYQARINSSQNFYELTELNPYREYKINVGYVNSQGEGDSYEKMPNFTTLEDVPGQPMILNLSSDMTSITVALGVPEEPNGRIIEYHVSAAVYLNFSSSFTRSVVREGEENVTMVTLANLDADTLYFIRATASTKVGIGEVSSIQQIVTKQSTPRPPTNVTSDLSFRNETCIKLIWNSPDNTNGTILNYKIIYKEQGTNQPKESITTTTSTALICNLKSGYIYEFSIVSINDMGESKEAIVSLSVEQPDPPSPPIPDILNTTSETIGVALDPVLNVRNNAYQYGYVLSIDDVTRRSKRATSTSNTSCPGINEIPGKVIRNFTHTDMLHRISFVIGDGKTYGSYKNEPLTENHFYDIYFLIFSYFDGVCKYNFVKVPNPVKAAVVVVKPVEPQVVSTNDNTGLIIGLVILAILIVAIIVIFLICCWLRLRQGEQKYEPYVNEKDDFDMKIYQRLDDYNPQKYWNTIHSLRESRYIVVGREYLPENKHFQNGSVAMANGGPPIMFHDEFANLPHGRLASYEVALKRQNERKNRFNHLLPYDHSRVILDPDVNSSSDYINANFIKGYQHQQAYIAAQSPFDDDTVLDFWRMIYQYQVNVIVMMANIVEDNIVKCTQYWPTKGRVMYGQFVLDLVDEQEHADYTIRSIRVRLAQDRNWHRVTIFDMTSWPEHGVPDDPIPLLEIRRKANTFQTKHGTPIVVHCGTGVSRTGVYIAVDSLLEQYETEGRISVYSFIRKMRKDRPAMVRTLKQYVFIYEAIFEAMVAGNTLTGPDDLKDVYHSLTKKNPHNNHSYLHGQFMCLEQFTRKIFPSMCTSALNPANFDKNRFSEIVPPDQYRPVLCTPGGFNRTDYVNAVYLDSHRSSNHYIITQTPLHTTVIDFWKLVYDHDVYTIVMMEPKAFEDDTSAVYWPEDHMKQYEPFFVETVNVYQQENITIRNLKLTCMSNPKDMREIRQFQFNAWAETEFVPKSKSMLLDVVDLMNDWQNVKNKNSTPILVHCKDGATHSGLFISLCVLCEKVYEDGEVDLFHTVKHLKRRRTQIVDTLDQYRFCYKALWDFINMRMPGGVLTEQMSKTYIDKPYPSLSLTSYSTDREYMPY